MPMFIAGVIAGIFTGGTVSAIVMSIMSLSSKVDGRRGKRDEKGELKDIDAQKNVEKPLN